MITIHQWTIAQHGLTGRARLADGTPVPLLPPQGPWDRDRCYAVPDGTPLQLEYTRAIGAGRGWRWADLPAPACFGARP